MGGRGVASPDNKQPLQRMEEAPFEKNALYFPPNKSLGEAMQSFRKTARGVLLPMNLIAEDIR